MAIIQQSLRDALADRRLTELPSECGLDAEWQEAIVLVARAVGGVQSYAYATKKDGKISVVRDFGFAYQCSGIKDVLKVYPIGFVAASNVPSVQVNEEEEKIEESKKETANSVNSESGLSVNDEAGEANDDFRPNIELKKPTPTKKLGRPRKTDAERISKTARKNKKSVW